MHGDFLRGPLVSTKVLLAGSPRDYFCYITHELEYFVDKCQHWMETIPCSNSKLEAPVQRSYDFFGGPENLIRLSCMSRNFKRL